MDIKGKNICWLYAAKRMLLIISTVLCWSYYLSPERLDRRKGVKMEYSSIIGDSNNDIHLLFSSNIPSNIYLLFMWLIMITILILNTFEPAFRKLARTDSCNWLEISERIVVHLMDELLKHFDIVITESFL